MLLKLKSKGIDWKLTKGYIMREILFCGGFPVIEIQYWKKQNRNNWVSLKS